MILQFALNTIPAKFAAALISLALFVVLLFCAGWYTITYGLTDDRLPIPLSSLYAGANYLPNSPRIHARIAASEMQGISRDLTKAESHIRQALELTPNEYNYHLMLASILESQGNKEAAEKSYREALALAPSYIDVNWRLANNLLRQNKIKESLDYFRVATNKNLSVLPNCYDLIWSVSNGDIPALTGITNSSPKAQLMLAQYLARQSKFNEAAAIFRSVDREASRAEPESAFIINELVNTRQLVLARELWGELLTIDATKPQPIIWNGSFESPISTSLGQFDWAIKDSTFARIVIDPQEGKTGGNSLRIYFLGKDTSRIDGEIKQTLMLKPGKHYRLDCQYKIRDLTTPMGPRIVITDVGSKNIIAGSEVIPEGSHASWQPIGFEFTAPASSGAVLLQIQRIPQSGYDEPSRGYLWFDDFTLKELP
jgi:tetratricopeptide (TPR) repeat protein